MFKFIATAAIAAASVIAPAHAYTNGGVALYSALDEAGVKITTLDCTANGHAGSYGVFIPSQNHIYICEENAVTDAQQWETIRHEAVHAAQRCVDPSMNTMLMSEQWLTKNSYESDAQFIMNNYPKAHWINELEAFTLMRYSNQDIARLVNEACN